MFGRCRWAVAVRAGQGHTKDGSVAVLHQLAHVNSGVLLSLTTSNAARGLWGEGGVLACSSVEKWGCCGGYMVRAQPCKIWTWKNKERIRSWKIQRTEVLALCRVVECQKIKSVCRSVWQTLSDVGVGVVFKKVVFNHHSSTLLGCKWTTQPTGFYRTTRAFRRSVYSKLRASYFAKEN